jgi:tripartite motif-containing protein 71
MLTGLNSKAWLVIVVIASLWLGGCEATGATSEHHPTPISPPSSPQPSLSPTVLTGGGTTWRVVAKADGEVSGLALDGHGHIFAVENRIVEFSLQGSVVRQWGTTGSGPGQFNLPIRVALDAAGDVFVTDAGNNRIQKFSPSGQPLAQWGHAGTTAGEFNFPVGITVDGQGDLYVADFRNGRIQKLAPSGVPLAAWGSQGSAPGQFDGGPGGLALDAHGNVYVSEAYGSSRIHEFSPAGAFIARWGATGSGPGEFNEPRGLAFDRDGNIYVGDTGNNRVEKLSPSGQFIAEWQGPSAFPFPEPSYIILDEKGDLYASDGPLILETCIASSGCG